MVGDLLADIADISLDTIPKIDRIRYIAVTTWAFTDSVVFVIQTTKVATEMHAKLQLLSSDILAIFVTAFAVLVILSKLSDMNKSGLKIIETYFSIFAEQPCNHSRRRLSRFIILIWIFSVFMIGNFYKNNLVANMAFTETPKIPQSFEDLQTWKPPYDPVYLHNIGGSEHDFFVNSGNSVLRDLGARMNTLITNVTECLGFVLNNKHAACVGWASGFDYEMSRKSLAALKYSKEYESLYRSKVIPEASYFNGFGLPKGSIYENAINSYMGRAKGAYLLQLWYKRVLNRFSTMESSAAARLDDMKNWCPLTFHDIKILFRLLGFGFITTGEPVMNAELEIYNEKFVPFLLASRN